MTSVWLKISVWLFINGSIFIESEAARILVVIPTPSISHQVVFRPLFKELAKRGHEVVVITTDPAYRKGEAPENLTEIDLHDVSYKYWRENFKLSEKGWKHDLIYNVEMANQHFTNIFELQLQNEEFQRLISEESFDLVFIEANLKPAYVLSHIFKAPMILISSLGAGSGIYDIVGAPTHPFLYPNFIRLRSYNLTLFEKIEELYYHLSLVRNYCLLEQKVNDMLQRNFGLDVPLIHELKDNVHMLFLNMHPILEGNNPVPPNVIHLWGLHQEPENELPDDIKSYLDNSKNGVIYISFGSNIRLSMLPKDKMEIMMNVLHHLPYDILLKCEEEEKYMVSSNIKTDKWFPQSDLLRHPSIKLFITQGGLQSTDEAIKAGVPLLGIPMAADQWYNTEKYTILKIGKKLELDDMSEHRFRKDIETIIRDESYRSNIAKLHSLLKDQPTQPLERAVWWTEHVLRHGGARHLRAPAANISWTQYFEIQLVLILVTGLLTSAIVLVTVIYYLYKTLFRILCKNGSAKIKSH